MRSRVVVPFLLGALLSSLTAAVGGEDLCKSPDFRKAFLEGRQSEDYPSMSSTLIGFGDRALPCLKAIVNGKGAEMGIAACASDQRGCQKWALGAIGRVGTPEARGYLTCFLRGPNDPDLLTVAILSVANLRDEQARPALVALLKHPNMQVRSKAVLSLGVIGNREDFDGMLAATLSLPPREIYTGAQGLLKLGDPRAIEPLEEHARTLSDPTYRSALQTVIKDLQLRRDSRHQ
jgi:hypothetical protein